MKNRILILMLLFGTGCRKDAGVLPHEEEPGSSDSSGLKGFYILNEGNMGTNRASLDFYDLRLGVYKKNIYGEINPTATKELGDVGNDLQIYGSKLYAVINGSDKVEVMEAATAKRIGQIDIPNGRYITFGDGKAYISSYAGAIGDPSSPRGFVAEVDTASLQITRQVTVGRQPEEMAVVDGKLYVANSGGYSPPDYERTVSVVDLKSLTAVKNIDVAINLHHVVKDADGDIYVNSRGDYYGSHSNLYVIDTQRDEVKDSLGVAAQNIVIHGDSAYIYSVEWSYEQNANVTRYALIDTKTEKVISRSFITDGTQAEISIPYGLAVNPVNGDIYVTDAKDYVTPGTLYCFTRDGVKKWSVTTGDIPAHIAFLP